MRPVSLRRAAARLSVLALAAAPVARAQSPDATIKGQVVDDNSHAPIAGAVIVLAGRNLQTISDSVGNFAIGRLKPGSYVLQVRAAGYAKFGHMLDLTPGQTFEAAIELTRAPGQELPSVSVTGEKSAGRRFADFELRRSRGRGHFITRAELQKQNALNLSDALRMVRGIHSDCSGTQCRIRMVRAQMGCEPQYFVDGYPSNTFGPNTPISDVQGIEIYVGPSETPPEFLTGNADCGVIAVWTRSAP